MGDLFMTDKEKLLSELKAAFEKTKKQLKFKATFEEIDDICYIEDAILSSRAVSSRYDRQLINRIVETSYAWLSGLHSLVFPSQDLISMHESKTISQEERKEIMKIMSKIMYFTRKSKRIAFTKNYAQLEGEFVDEIIDFYKKIFVPFMHKNQLQLENFWQKESEK